MRPTFWNSWTCISKALAVWKGVANALGLHNIHLTLTLHIGFALKLHNIHKMAAHLHKELSVADILLFRTCIALLSKTEQRKCMLTVYHKKFWTIILSLTSLHYQSTKGKITNDNWTGHNSFAQISSKGPSSFIINITLLLRQNWGSLGDINSELPLYCQYLQLYSQVLILLSNSCQLLLLFLQLMLVLLILLQQLLLLFSACLIHLNNTRCRSWGFFQSFQFWISSQSRRQCGSQYDMASSLYRV